MRSCSGWPCGVWIDGDARTAPDGTSFAWQHWSHTFEYALAAGPGDWRSAGFPLAGLDYNRDLLACETGRHAGPLPAAASLASAEPATAVLSALKPSGNPLASGRTAGPRREDGVTARLRDVSGRAGPGTALLRLAPGLAAARLTGPAEQPGGEPLPLRRRRGGSPAAGRRHGDHGADDAAVAGRRPGRGRPARPPRTARQRRGLSPAAGLHPLLAAREGPGAGREPAGGRAPLRPPPTAAEPGGPGEPGAPAAAGRRGSRLPGPAASQRRCG